MQRVCTMFQISKEGLHSFRRDRKHTKARQAAVFLLKELTTLSLNEIGIIVGRNHSTVHATLKKVRQRMSEDDFFLKQMQSFQQEFDNKTVTQKSSGQKHYYGF